jgi:serine phosphatase RsbU (regulator of sigma subunit)/PAS domain-containing protein
VSADNLSARCRFELALEGAELGVWEWDVHTGGVSADARAATLHGIDPSAFDERLETFFGHVHPDDQADLHAAARAALAACDRLLHEYRVVRADGTTAWVQSRGQALCDDEHGGATHLVAVSAETTTLRRARERAGRMLEHVSDGVMVLDTEWRIVFANFQAARLLQREVSGLTGRVLWDEFPGLVDSPFGAAYRRALRSQQIDVVEAYYGPLEGWFEVRIFPAPDGLTIYFRNVDERRTADQERNWLIAELSASLTRSQQLLELTRALAESLTEGDVARTVTEHTRAALGSRFAGLALLDEEAQSMRFVSMAPLPESVVTEWSEFSLDTPIPGTDVVRHGEQITHANREEILAAYPHIAADIEQAGTEAWTTLPLVASGRTIGALQVTWSRPHTIDEHEQRFLVTLAGQCAQAIARSRLFDRQRTVAATLQHAILPRQLPAVPGLALAARYDPAGHGVDIGGDWYDAFELTDGRLVVVVGDVGGHGIPAAAAMGQLRNAARAYALEGHEPNAIMTRLNLVLDRGDEAAIATVVCAVVDPTTGVVRWCSAGHPPPLLLEAGDVRLLEQLHGPLLGADSGTLFSGSELQLAPGATLLLYTDGLLEHRTRSLDAGLDELRAVAARSAPAGIATAAGLERFCDALVAGVLPETVREDDLCVLALTRTG